MAAKQRVLHNLRTLIINIKVHQHDAIFHIIFEYFFTLVL